MVPDNITDTQEKSEVVPDNTMDTRKRREVVPDNTMDMRKRREVVPDTRNGTFLVKKEGGDSQWCVSQHYHIM